MNDHLNKINIISKCKLIGILQNSLLLPSVAMETGLIQLHQMDFSSTPSKGVESKIIDAMLPNGIILLCIMNIL